MNRQTSEKGLERIRQHEAFRAKMYLDSAGLPTIGYGTLIDTAGEQYLMTATITKSEAEELFKRDVSKFEKAVNDSVKVPINQNQFDALVSFTYNVGAGNLRSSTLLKRINRNEPQETIAQEFSKWVFSGGKKVGGLITRRGHEAVLFLTEVAKKKDTQLS